MPLPSAFIECWPADVYDPFLGSGTTLIAAHRLGRVCYGCEIEPKYADVILKRAEAEGMACAREEPGTPEPLVAPPAESPAESPAAPPAKAKKARARKATEATASPTLAAAGAGRSG